MMPVWQPLLHLPHLSTGPPGTPGADGVRGCWAFQGDVASAPCPPHPPLPAACGPLNKLPLLPVFVVGLWRTCLGAAPGAPRSVGGRLRCPLASPGFALGALHEAWRRCDGYLVVSLRKRRVLLLFALFNALGPYFCLSGPRSCSGQSDSGYSGVARGHLQSSETFPLFPPGQRVTKLTSRSLSYALKRVCHTCPSRLVTARYSQASPPEPRISRPACSAAQAQTLGGGGSL